MPHLSNCNGHCPMPRCTHKISWPHELLSISSHMVNCTASLDPHPLSVQGPLQRVPAAFQVATANSCSSHLMYRAPNRQEHIFFHRSALQLDRKPDWGKLSRLHQMRLQARNRKSCLLLFLHCSLIGMRPSCRCAAGAWVVRCMPCPCRCMSAGGQAS